MKYYLKVAGYKGDANKKARKMDAVYNRVKTICEHCQLDWELDYIPHKPHSELLLTITNESATMFTLRHGYSMHDLRTAIAQHSEFMIMEIKNED